MIPAPNARLGPALLLAMGCRAPSADSDAPPDDTGFDPKFDAFVAALEADLANSDAPAVSAAVWIDGEVVFAEAFGSARPDEEMEVTDHTLFQLGSTTKMFTAVALLQQIEAGAVALDTSLAEALPDLEFELDPSWGDQIRIEHLLTHQGAFYDYIDWAGSSDDEDLAEWTLGLYAQYLWLMNPPGMFWNYSNPNFTFAGLIAERKTDTPYPDLMRDRVFEPLGMERTYQRKADVEADGDYALGVGYDADTGEYGPIDLEAVPDLAAGRPAGSGTWTTPTELLEMAEFLIDGDPGVLSDELRAEMTTAQVPLLSTADDSGYGYGVFVYPGFDLTDGYHPTVMWDHGGNTLSYSSAFYMLPDQRFAVAILSSGYGTDFSASAVTAFQTLVELPDPIEGPEYLFDPAELDAHVGTYVDEYNVGEIVITREGDELRISMPLLDELGFTVDPALVAVSSDLFFVSIDGAWFDLTFIEGPDGAESQYLRNRAFVGTRTDQPTSVEAAPDRTEIERLLRDARLSAATTTATPRSRRPRFAANVRLAR